MVELNGVTVTPVVLTAFNLLQTPIWLFDLHYTQILWANQAALPLWDAVSVEELLERSFSLPSEALLLQWQACLQQLQQGKPVVETWTFHLKKPAVVVQCHLSCIGLDMAQTAILVEGNGGSAETPDKKHAQGLEIRFCNQHSTPKVVMSMATREPSQTLQAALSTVESVDEIPPALDRQERQLETGLEPQGYTHTAQLQQVLAFETTLKRISDHVRDSLDERLVLETVVQDLAVTLQVICCDIALYNEARTTSTICYDYTDGSIPSAQGKVVQIAESYDPAIHVQLLQGHCFQFCPLVLNQARPLKEPIAILACPVVDDEGVLGDMWLSKPKQAFFNELEIRLIQQVANQAAIALRQARLYQAAQAQINELDRLNRLKDNFLSTVSHELRSPMANIKMATQMLEIVMVKAGLFDQGQSGAKQYFRILQEECQRELDLINDLLDLARLDAEAEPLQLTTVDLRLWLPHLVEPFVEQAHQQERQFLLGLPDDLPLLTTDVRILTRVLSELLTNACKYTPAGEQIALTAQGKSDVLQLSIRNSGIEIPVTELSLIFDKFYRIPNNDPWKHGGTGLGLALVQKLVEHLGATIDVVSTAGQTTFVVSCPLYAE